MSKYVLLTDGSNDLTRDLRERFGIADYFPGLLEYPDGHQELAGLDWENMSPEEYYGGMNKKTMYKTAARGLGSQEQFFESWLEKGQDILFLTISQQLSSTYSTAVIAARNLKEKYPDRQIRVIDTHRYSGAAGLIASLAGDMRLAGKSLEETASFVESVRDRVHQMGTVDDLTFLKNMGRISSVNAIMGSFISIKPMAECAENGLSQVIGKTKGYPNMYKVCIEYMKRTLSEEGKKRIFISCTNRKVQAQKLEELVKDNFAPEEIIPTTVSMTCGASVGPGMVAAFYIGTPVSAGLTEETAIMNEVLAKL